MRLLFSLIFGWCLCNTLFAGSDKFRVVFYNVENFFDCQDDTLKQDEEFLPGGLRGWSQARFYAKAGKIARVLASIGENGFPDLVGMAEVENDHCLNLLTRYSPLKNAGYSYIHEESPDLRGVDVCLLYNRYRFTVLKHQALRIVFPEDTIRKTRDVLFVTGLTSGGDTLHLFVCHFPSRLGGQARSESSRRYVAASLRQQTDSILRQNQCAKILIMGDFNDYPDDVAIHKELGAGLSPPVSNSPALFNLMSGFLHKPDVGTHKNQGEWGCLDQMIVSTSLFCQVVTTAIFAPDFLLTEDVPNLGKKPFRTYEGMRFSGGYSDHLPVWTDIRMPCH